MRVTVVHVRVVHPSPTSGLTPPFVLEERLDALSNLVPNLPDPSERSALGILQRPIIAFQTRHDWTLVPTPHRD